jgi:hypothetical protein
MTLTRRGLPADHEATDWNEVRGLPHEAYRQVALKRMLKALDGNA